ncbi:MAG: alpha/beta fold hydrolase [Acidimicrobiales bacterium]
MSIHLVEQGGGPAVLLVHGFPETSYSWRHQLPALAAAGYRAVAIDVRGYGGSSRPASVDEYRMVRHVADNVAVAEALGEDHVVVVGHDWGAPIAWSSTLMRPDLFDALVLLSVPYAPPGAEAPTGVFARVAGPEHEFYMSYFQEPGRVEAEIGPDVRGFLAGVYLGASGDAPPGTANFSLIPRGATFQEMLPRVDTWPELGWMAEEDFARYVGAFEETGLTGGLNRYRNLDGDWADFAAFRGRPIGVPTLFVGGERDGPTIWGTKAIGAFDRTLSDCRGVHVLSGIGHWIQQEAAVEVNRLLLAFLAEVRPT